MEEGSIAERGGHEELLEKKGVYYGLWEAQAEYYTDKQIDQGKGQRRRTV